MKNFAVFAVLILGFGGISEAVIPDSERQVFIPDSERWALINFYNSTDGASWTHRDNWRNTGDTDFNAVGTECTWWGITCNPAGDSVVEIDLPYNNLSGTIPTSIGDLPNLTMVDLFANSGLTGSIPTEIGTLLQLETLKLGYGGNLSGTIPSSLGNLSNLLYLALDDNQLTGSIPPELGNLSNLESLFLNYNQLDGTIPPQLGTLSNLRGLYLDSNQLSGTIPLDLGDLSNLTYLQLSSNQLSGTIPLELGNLSALGDGSGLDLRWNALHSDDVPLIIFLNGKQDGGDWQSTQTIAPVNLTLTAVSDHSLWFSWDSVAYVADPGGYEVFVAPMSSGLWTSCGWTSDKAATQVAATDLDAGSLYDAFVVSYTDPHANNDNLVISDAGIPIIAATTNAGCLQPVILMDWGHETTLSLDGAFDTYLWSTGETTPTIMVVPVASQWYWVTVEFDGSCEETAVIFVVSEILFSDDFESGNTSAWSNVIP